MPIYKRCDYCRARLKPGEACACRKKADPVKKETYAGYGTGAWKGKRAAILEKYCHLDLYEFAKSGTITAADSVVTRISLICVITSPTLSPAADALLSSSIPVRYRP